MDSYCAYRSKSLAGGLRVKLLIYLQFYVFDYKDFLNLNLTMIDTFEFCSSLKIIQYKNSLSHIIYSISVIFLVLFYYPSWSYESGRTKHNNGIGQNLMQ